MGCLVEAEEKLHEALINSRTFQQWVGAGSAGQASQYSNFDELPWLDESELATSDFPDLDHDQLDSQPGRDERFAIVGTQSFAWVSEGTPGELQPRGVLVLVLEERYEGVSDNSRLRAFKDNLVTILKDVGNYAWNHNTILPSEMLIDDNIHQFNWNENPASGTGYRSVTFLTWDHSAGGGVGV